MRVEDGDEPLLDLDGDVGLLDGDGGLPVQREGGLAPFLDRVSLDVDAVELEGVLGPVAVPARREGGGAREGGRHSKGVSEWERAVSGAGRGGSDGSWE